MPKYAVFIGVTKRFHWPIKPEAIPINNQAKIAELKTSPYWQYMGIAEATNPKAAKEAAWRDYVEIDNTGMPQLK